MAAAPLIWCTVQRWLSPPAGHFVEDAVMAVRGTERTINKLLGRQASSFWWKNDGAECSCIFGLLVCDVVHFPCRAVWREHTRASLSESILAVSISFKAGRYQSLPAYHLGPLGSRYRAPEPHLSWTRRPYVPEAPPGWSHFAVVGVSFVMRKIDVAFAVASHVTVNDDEAVCVCVVAASCFLSCSCRNDVQVASACPYHTVVAQLAHLRAHSGHQLSDDLPHFPSCTGRAVGKAVVVQQLINTVRAYGETTHSSIGACLLGVSDRRCKLHRVQRGSNALPPSGMVDNLRGQVLVLGLCVALFFHEPFIGRLVQPMLRREPPTTAPLSLCSSSSPSTGVDAFFDKEGQKDLGD